MEERLIIQGFAGIKNYQISLNQLNILIGPQATGKSICAKSIYFFKRFVSDLITAITEDKTEAEFKEVEQERFTSYFPSSNWGKRDFLIRYELGLDHIQVVRNGSSLQIDYSNFYRTLYKSGIRQRKSMQKQNQSTDKKDHVDFPIIIDIRDSLLEKAESYFGTRAVSAQRFIPAGRSFFAILESSIFTFLSNNKALDPFLVEFGAFYENMKHWKQYYSTHTRNKQEQQLYSNINSMLEEILCGKYTITGREEYLESADGRHINLAASSSGQQEMLPLAIILGSIPLLRSSYGYTIYIEEPEAHLFPSAQKRIVELIAVIYRSIPFVQFVITTHSPYILTAFNNLIHAGNLESTIKSRAKRKKLYEVVPKEQVLHFEDVEAYDLHSGMSTSLMSNETRLITTNILDSVSDDLSTQFAGLLAID